MTATVEDELFDRDELRRRLHNAATTEYIRIQCKSGKWPHIKVGRTYLFSEAHFEQIKSLCEVKPTVTPEKTWGRRTRGSSS